MTDAPLGLIVAGPSSGTGKTTLALGLMRALSRRGIAVQPFKNGPDYIDPAFHARATGRQSFNLDTWAMSPALMAGLLDAARGSDLAIVEGSMGLFDGAGRAGVAGIGATADIAAMTGWPVVLVLDVTGQAQTAAALALGCGTYRKDVVLAGVVLNRVASERHRTLAAAALAAVGIPVLGAIGRSGAISLPERHLGLVQADEIGALDGLLDRLADEVERAADLDAIRAAARPMTRRPDDRAPMRPPAQRIAVSSDTAFSFLYPHLLSGWRAAGAEILPFSPLADEAPDPSADLVWLSGGYPELHAGRIAGNRRFLDGLKRHAARRPVHGECGGYMALGQGLIDATGARHAMAGLLGLETDFSKRQLHLGYRAARLLDDAPFGRKGDLVRGHEFHYARTVSLGGDPPLYEVRDALGGDVEERGSRRGSVTGSFIHMIDAGSPEITPPSPRNKA